MKKFKNSKEIIEKLKKEIDSLKDILKQKENEKKEFEKY